MSVRKRAARPVEKMRLRYRLPFSSKRGKIAFPHTRGGVVLNARAFPRAGGKLARKNNQIYVVGQWSKWRKAVEGEGRGPLERVERVERKKREGVQSHRETRNRVQSSCCSIKPEAVYPPPSTSPYAYHTHKQQQ